MHTRVCVTFATLLIALPCAASFGDVTVPATSDLFSAGQATADVGRGGTLPIKIDLAPGTNRTIRFSVTGTVRAGDPNFWPLVGPDGGTTMANGPISTNLNSASGISGMVHPNFEFLAGVFLDATTPVAGTEPAILNFNTIGTNFPTLSPQLRQSFAIGDGLTGNGSGIAQTFHVPDSATRLYLGVVDGFNFTGTPSQFQDNSGSFNVTITPEPASLFIGASALLLLLGRRKATTSKLL